MQKRSKLTLAEKMEVAERPFRTTPLSGASLGEESQVIEETAESQVEPSEEWLAKAREARKSGQIGEGTATPFDGREKKARAARKNGKVIVVGKDKIEKEPKVKRVSAKLQIADWERLSELVAATDSSDANIALWDKVQAQLARAKVKAGKKAPREKKEKVTDETKEAAKAERAAAKELVKTLKAQLKTSKKDSLAEAKKRAAEVRADLERQIKEAQVAAKK